jgi:ABC-type nitrate/sulfonate/bicarbonate transport system substrate-binding protein
LHLVVSLVAVLGFGGNGEARKVRIATGGFEQSIQTVIAKEKGYYREEGLEVEHVVMSSGVANLALIGGNVEVSTGGGTTVPALLRGAPLVFLFLAYQRPMYSIYAQPDIRDVTGLRGKKIAVSNLGSSSDSLLREVLRKHGLKGGSDVTILGMGGVSDRYTALTKGFIDAAMLLGAVNLQAENAGFRELVSLVKEDLFALASSIAVRQEVVQSDAALVERFVRGTLKGFLYSRSQRAGTIAIYARTQKISEDMASKIYDAMLRPAMTSDGTLSEDIQKRVLDQEAGRLGIKEVPAAEKVFDFSFVRRVRAQLDSQGWSPKP